MSASRSRRTQVLVTTVLAALALGLLVLTRPEGRTPARSQGAPLNRAELARSFARARRRSAPPDVVVTVRAGTRAVPVPASFFGLSTEYWTLPIFEGHRAVFERVLSLLHVRGGGPMILRIGGDSADRTYWDPREPERLPSWAFELDPRWLAQMSGLVRRMNLRLILDLNLVTGSPSLAARWARAAHAGLPRGSIIGFEVGNEPDIYARWYWLAAVSRTSFAPRLLPSFISAGSYTQDFHAYARALRRAVPGVPLFGPALANPRINANWISDLLAAERPVLGMITAHRYPYSACLDGRSPVHPTIPRILSERATAGVVRSIRPAVRLAHRARLPFRLTELNSVTCGGLRGVSNTFATALWAPDALFSLLRAGVDGVNVHVRDDAINGPFRMTGHGIWARPLLYGLALFTRTLGPDAALVPVAVHMRHAFNVATWSVEVRGGRLHVLVINKGDRSLTTTLHLPSGASATVQRLIAPSVHSQSGVTFDGRWLGSDGRWHGRHRTQTVTPSTAGYQLSLPRYSAALLSVSTTAISYE